MDERNLDELRQEIRDINNRIRDLEVARRYKVSLDNIWWWTVFPALVIYIYKN
jgi:hypothetical protein